ncbi:MAG TPA: hypothetical protein VFH78_03460 [Candidatus Thermoplasmatota archaeon]|nr:hypothetical protein [Candidatus Thermoplasmatota archaeon]
MTARTLLVATLLLGSIAAGCIGPQDDGPAPGDANDSDFNQANPLGGNRLVAFEETNKTEEGVGGVDHHHDLWNGATRVDLFSTQAYMRPFDPRDAAGYQAYVEFTPPDAASGEAPKLIYEGTAVVEFTISDPQRHACGGRARLGGFHICTDTTDDIFGTPEIPPVDDPNPPSGLKLRYKHASTNTWIDVGELTWGAPLAIKINDPTETDMPHATSSAWAFQVLSPNQQDATLVFTASATIVRGEGEIPLWPGHPDFYADTCCRVVLEATAQACDTAGCELATQAGPLTPQKLISYGTRTLYVWVNITSVTADPVLAPDVWFLWHWNTSGRDNITNIFDKENHGFDVREHHWVLPVDDGSMDSPYADGSKWRFALGGAFYKEGISCYGGCANWVADYTIKVIATNEVLPLEKYDMDCLRNDYCPQPEGGAGDGSRERAVRRMA